MNENASQSAKSSLWLRPFVEFLNEQKALASGDLPKLLKFYQELDRRVGQLSVMKGFMTPQDVFLVLGEQADGEKSFGEIALGRKLIKQSQLDEVLKLQADSFELFQESLRVLKIVDRKKLAKLVKEFGKTPKVTTAGGKTKTQLEKGEVRKVLRKMRSLGTLPAIIQKILALLDDPNSDFRNVAETIKSDPVLSSQMLRLANSASSGAIRSISNLREAVSRIGIRGIRGLVMTTVVLDKFKGKKAEALKKIWLHSALTSQWAQVIAKERKIRPADDAFVAGLVHDVGRPVLYQYFPEPMAEVEKQMKGGAGMEEAERACLGQTHADVGGFLCHMWGFPPLLTAAVQHHHVPARKLTLLRNEPDMNDVVHAACALSNVEFDREDDEKNKQLLAGLDSELREFHGIGESTIAHVREVYQKAKSLKDLLQ